MGKQAHPQEASQLPQQALQSSLLDIANKHLVAKRARDDVEALACLFLDA
jgi:hypothetical protein